MSLLIAVLAALGYALGSLLQSAAVSRRVHAATTARIVRLLAGLALDAAAWLLSLVALRHLPVYVVQAVLAGSLAFTVVLARIWQHARLRARDLVAIGAVIPALAVIAYAGREQGAPLVDRLTTISLTVFGTVAVLAVGIALVAAHGRSDRGPSVLALVGGLSFSATALAGRAVRIDTPVWHTVLHPLPWVVVVTGVAGTVSYTAALQRGPVGPATAQLWAVEVVVPAVVAVPLLGDTVRPGWLPAAAFAVIVVVAATTVLALAGTAHLATSGPKVADPEADVPRPRQTHRT
ncbi:hypothetical protein [Actinoplanes sp. HUAS TT8]|uniref:hypothetical protein n=1 Tax=Actinoplanes sp. HUAS TT8 TaxID=3447453 RepID=UPI003F522D5C